MRTATATCAASTELHQIHHVDHRAFAIAAIVVEELDHRDVALRIADHDLPAGIEDHFRILLDGAAGLLGFGRALAFLHLRHHLLQQFGIGEQVAPDDGLDLALLRWRNALRLRGSVHGQRQQHRRCGGERTAE
jgi:hypothetical protein